jgi:hypothetical protein
MDGSSKRDLIRVEVFPTCFALDLVGSIAKNFFNTGGTEFDVGIQSEV